MKFQEIDLAFLNAEITEKWLNQGLVYPAFDATLVRFSIVTHFLEHQLPASRVYLGLFDT